MNNWYLINVENIGNDVILSENDSLTHTFKFDYWVESKSYRRIEKIDKIFNGCNTN